MGYILKQMTEGSWILQKDGTRLSLLTTATDGTIRSIGKLEKSIFKDLDDLESFLGSKLEIDHGEEIITEELGTVRGYPVKHTGIVESEHSDLPVYNRGRVEHAAGYYGIRFKHGWTASYCPKLSTLTENEFIGPFTSKLEMQNAMSQKKRMIEI